MHSFKTTTVIHTKCNVECLDMHQYAIAWLKNVQRHQSTLYNHQIQKSKLRSVWTSSVQINQSSDVYWWGLSKATWLKCMSIWLLTLIWWCGSLIGNMWYRVVTATCIQGISFSNLCSKRREMKKRLFNFLLVTRYEFPRRKLAKLCKINKYSSNFFKQFLFVNKQLSAHSDFQSYPHI